MILEPIYDSLIYWGMITLVLGVLIIIVGRLITAFSVARKGIVLASIILLTLPASLAVSGLLLNESIKPPPFVFVMLYVLALSFWIGLSNLGLHARENISIIFLIALQVFRLPLELLMHQAYERGIMPEILSFSGINFDIFTGVGALIITLYWCWKGTLNRFWIWLWNLFGISCLTMIFFIAITSSPVVRMWGDAPEKINSWVIFFPYIWLPTVLVVIAIVSHIIVTRKLLASRKTSVINELK